jgi:hypothetical protein
MDWFYRRLYTLPFVAKIVPPTWPKITGYIILYMILSIAFSIGIYIFSEEGQNKIAIRLSLANSMIGLVMFVPFVL